MSNSSNKIYVECTQTYTSPLVRTGIQRVVRNIINNSPDVDLNGYQIIPVVVKDDAFFAIPTFQIQNDTKIYKSFKARIWNLVIPFVQKSYKCGILLFGLIGVNALVEKSLGAEGVFRLKKKIKNLLKVSKKKVFTHGIGALPIGELVQFRLGDILILLDSSWDKIGEAVDKVPPAVVKIGVVYDLVPILHQTYCDDWLVAIFQRWLADVRGKYNGFLCISRSVQSELNDYLADAGIKGKKVDYFYLGSDLDLKTGAALSKNEYLASFDPKVRNFLVVGTLEPRKNVQYILEAFDLFLNQNPNVAANLWFVGKTGWKIEDFSLKLKKHPFFNKKIFHLENIEDEDLDYLYSNSSVLIQASKAEGFGLPIVEALKKNLPVFASDIPVFRELGQYCKSVYFFSLESPDQLASYMADNLPLKPNSFVWPSWRDATRVFYQKSIAMANDVRQCTETNF